MPFLFTQSADGVFTPQAIAAGPFHNLHGGAAAAVMHAVAAEAAPVGFLPISQRTEFLRSTPLSEFTLSIETAKSGRSHCVYDVSILRSADGAVSARSSITFFKPSPAPHLDAVETKPWGGHTDPNTLENLPDMPSPFGGEWMIQATDVRTDLQGVYWFRMRGPLLSDGRDNWFGRVIAVSDWVSGFVSPGFPDPNSLSVWPNTDITLHTEREHHGDWIGIRPIGRYRDNGIGLGRGEVFDEEGLVGHVLTNTIGPAT